MAEIWRFDVRFCMVANGYLRFACFSCHREMGLAGALRRHHPAKLVRVSCQVSFKLICRIRIVKRSEEWNGCLFVFFEFSVGAINLGFRLGMTYFPFDLTWRCPYTIQDRCLCWPCFGVDFAFQVGQHDSRSLCLPLLLQRPCWKLS